MAQRKTTAKKKTGTGTSARKASKTKTSASTGKKPASKETKRTIAKKKSFIESELKVIAALAAGGFILLTDLGLMGGAGDMLLRIQKGLFGQGYLLLAVSIALAAGVAVKYRNTYFVKLKTVCVFGVLIDASAVIHLIFSGDGKTASTMSAGELYRRAAEGASGGGMIGGCITNLLKGVVGYAGAYLVLAALLIVFFVIITEKSFVNAARIGAEKTAEAVRNGAGKTVEAAKYGHEMYQQIHRENVIRRDAEREERRKRIEAGFTDFDDAAEVQGTNGSRGFAVDTEAFSAASDGITDKARAAEVYAGYGRDIIGDWQRQSQEADKPRTPVFASDYRSTKHTDGVDFDTELIGGVLAPEDNRLAAEPVKVREINYDSDEIPFDEDEEERYKSYAHILDSSVISLDTAQRAGFAVNIESYTDMHQDNSDREIIEPEHFDAFKTAPVQEAAAAAAETETASSDDTDVLREAYSIDGAFEAYKDIRKNAESISIADIRAEARTAFAGNEAALTAAGNAKAAGGLMEETEAHPVSDAYQTDEVPGQDDYISEIYPDPIDDSYEGSYAGYAADDSSNDGSEYDGHAYMHGSADEDAGTENAGEYYMTATGKQMKSPDSYEADRILREKQGLNAARPAAGETKYPGSISTDVRKPSAAAAGSMTQNTGNDGEARHGTAQKPKPKPRPYVFPKAELLEKGSSGSTGNYEMLRKNAAKLQKVLRDFGVGVTVTNVIVGPRVSRYELTPDAGVKVSRITSLTGDIKLALAAREIRIEAPIPGKSAVGVEVPNETSTTVKFRDILESEAFKTAKSKLCWGVGLDIGGNTVISDIAKMPHILVAGTTGSGKSVGINSLIMSILYRATPQEVRMILVDPKQVEFTVYNGIPHLLTEVVTSPEKALSALNWAVAEMNRRYKLFQESGTRNIKGYNEKAEKAAEGLPEELRPEKLPFILIIIDELSELMMHAKKDVESCIVSLAQLARAAGIHLVVATQRPSVDVVTGLIKSNIPSRVAFKLPSVTDSRTILDSGGAETLLGNGDMLYKPGDKSSPIRVQGAFLSDDEVENVVNYVKKYNPKSEGSEIDDAAAAEIERNFSGQQSGTSGDDDRDDYFADAGRLIIASGKASIGGLQRKFKIGFNRAARIMDQLCEAGVVGDGEGTKERRILMDADEFENFLMQ